LDDHDQVGALMRDPFPYLARESFDESFDEFWIVMQTFSNLFLLLIVVALQVPPHIQQYRRDVRQEIWRQVGRRDESAPLGLPGGMDAVVVAGAQRSLCMSN
jgi:hypothetical protein